MAMIRVKNEELAKATIRSLMLAAWGGSEPLWWITRTITPAELSLYHISIDPTATADPYLTFDRAYAAFGVVRPSGSAYCGPLVHPATVATARRSVPTREQQLVAAGKDYAANQQQFAYPMFGG